MDADGDRRCLGKPRGAESGGAGRPPVNRQAARATAPGRADDLRLLSPPLPEDFAAIWLERFTTGKVWADGTPIDVETPYRPLLEVHYRREVEREPPVREDYRVVWSDRHLMVVDKPPNLPVTPGGRWVRGCLLHLLLEATGNDRIAPLHRLDRLTSGVLLLSLDPATRSHFARLFQPQSMVEKDYTAVCELQRDPPSQRFSLAHHIARSDDRVLASGRAAGVATEFALRRRGHGGGEAVWFTCGSARSPAASTRSASNSPTRACRSSAIPCTAPGPPTIPTMCSQRLWLDAHRLAVTDLGGVPGVERLSAEWTSSRSPAEFFQRAARL